jgi:flagellar hook-basal body complex protein FliE
MSTFEINRVLAEMRALAAQAAGMAPTASAAPLDSGAQLKMSPAQAVNTLPPTPVASAPVSEAGAPQLNISSLMIELQKAGLGFKEIAEVRNKLVDAYREVMNMPI